MRRGEEAEVFHRSNKGVIDDLRSVQRSGVNSLEADGVDLRKGGKWFAWPGNLVEAFADGGRVVGTLSAKLANALNPALSKHRFPWHLKYPVLERRTPDIRNEAIHTVLHFILD